MLCLHNSVVAAYFSFFGDRAIRLLLWDLKQLKKDANSRHIKPSLIKYIQRKKSITELPISKTGLKDSDI